ncbi:hypothetical protein P4480_06705 [Bacillus thuringiensis]
MGKVLRREGLGAGARLHIKWKPPNILAAGAGFHQIKKPPIGGFLIYLLLIFHFP